MRVLLLITLLIFSLSGCSTVSTVGNQLPDTPDYGPTVPLRVCVLRDVNLDPKDARGILASLKTHFAPYGLDLTFPRVQEWQRPAFRHSGILQDVARRPLEAPCDRLLALVGRDVRDFMWGLLLPEVLGAVETRTYSKGYVVAEAGSFNQLLTFTSPGEAAAHEMYHLLGVPHGDDGASVRRRIAHIKQLAADNHSAGRDFFPAVTFRGKVYLTRRDVDRRFSIPPVETCRAGAGADGC